MRKTYSTRYLKFLAEQKKRQKLENPRANANSRIKKKKTKPSSPRSTRQPRFTSSGPITRNRAVEGEFANDVNEHVENEPEQELNYDNRLMSNKNRKIDQNRLCLNEKQMDEIFRHFQTALVTCHRVLYLSESEILSNDTLPPVENFGIILMLFYDKNGNAILAAYDLIKKITWRFYTVMYQLYPKFFQVKKVLEKKLKFTFQDVHRNTCTRRINERIEPYDYIIQMLRTGEEIFLTGKIKYFKQFNLDAERKRYSEIYNLIHSGNHTFQLPATIQSEDSENDETEENITRNGTYAASSESEIQVIEPPLSNTERSSSDVAQNTIKEALSSISNFHDFDDVQPPYSPVPNPSTYDSFSSDNTQSSSFLDSTSINVVNNQLNTSVLPPNHHQLVSFNSRATPSTDHQEITSYLAQNTSNENDQPIYGPFLPPLEYNHIIEKWRRSLSPEECLGELIEYSSLSSIGSSSESEDDEEIDDGLSPRYYNDTNDSSDEEVINLNTARILTENCRAVNYSLYYYWECIRKLVEDRQKIKRKVVKRLPVTLIFCDDEEVLRINSLIDLVEHDINMFIPVVPRWKVSYQKDSDRKIIIRKGYIYERIGETNEFQCVYKEGIKPCSSFIVIDNCDIMIEGSFCYHNHPAADNEEYTNDVPPPAGTPISFQRVTKDGTNFRKYPKLIEFLKEILTELIKWKQQVIICSKKLKLLQKYLDDLTNIDHPNNKYGFRCKMVVAEASNLLNCVRLDK